MFEENWNSIPHEEYIAETRKRTRIIWVGNTFWYCQNGSVICHFGRFSLNELVALFNVTKTQYRKLSINSCDQWKEFFDSCNSTNCKNGKNWMDINVKKLTLKEWMITADVRTKPEFQFDEKRFNDNIIITVYDSRKQRRLIIDGIHRGAALTIACEKPYTRGDEVITIFPFDIIQL
jgi:hypothetical protein